MKRKAPVEIIEERMQRLRTSRMDTRLGTPAPRRKKKGWAGGKNKDNFGWETTPVEKALRTGLAKDDEDRKHSKRNAPD